MKHSSSNSVKTKYFKEEFDDEHYSLENNLVAASIDIPAINSIITKYLIQEEQSYLDSVKMVFEQSWNAVNLGERVIEDYIKFCKTKKNFSFEFIHLCNKQMR